MDVCMYQILTHACMFLAFKAENINQIKKMNKLFTSLVIQRNLTKKLTGKQENYQHHY